MPSSSAVGTASPDKADAAIIAKERSLHQQGRYGDIVMALFGHVGTWMYLFQTYSVLKSDKDESIKKKALVFIVLWIFPSFFYVPAIFKDSLWCSRFAMLAVMFLCATVNLMQYPANGECNITQEYINIVVMGVLANVSLSFHEKMARLGIIFVAGSYVSIHSPFSVYIEDTLPILGGTILLSIFILYVYHFSVAKEFATVQAARFVLAAIFFHHTIADMPDFEASKSEALTQLIKTAVLACVGVVATGTFQQEVDQKEQLEILVRKRTQKLHTVNMALQASETAIVITDKTGCMVWLNKAFENLCGKSERSLVGRLVKDVIHSCDPSRKENKFTMMESYEDSSRAREAELLIGDSIYEYESTPFLEHEEAGEMPSENNRFLMVFKDVTASRAREAAEQKAQDEAMMAKAMGDSMVTLTHELRTPLQGIMGIASMLLQGSELSMDAMDSVKLIMASSTLLLNLVNNLLDVKKATAKMLEEFPLSPVSATSPIQDAIVFSRPLASISDVMVLSDVESAPNSVVFSNSLRLQQVLINLVSNAIKYTAKGSEITVSTCESTVSRVHAMMDAALASSRDGSSTAEDSANDQAVLVFRVSDCGPGIEPDQADRLFQRFAQLDNQSSRSPGSSKIGQPSGTGLGLHLCQLFVQRMKGHIWATNNENGKKGSTFSFSLPLLSNELPLMNMPGAIITQDGQRRRTSTASHISVSTADGSLLIKEDLHLVYSQKILLVDDTLINRKVLSRILGKVGFSNVTTVESGEAALKKLSTERDYDLVISDLQMPGMSGTELSNDIAKLASNDDSFCRPVVIGLTADTGLDVAERCQASKMSDVLYKPITIGDVKKYAENVVLSLQPGVWHDGNVEREGSIYGSQASLPVQ